MRLEHNPAGWPADLLPVFEQSITCEFASLTRQGTPITFPLTPYLGEDERTLDVSTGLTYPAKAERARRNPQVALSYSDPVGSGLKQPPVVVVQGVATVWDRDLQANTDRYLGLSAARFPHLYKGMPAFMLRQLGWYYTRIWMGVTPLRITWWPGGRLDQPPQRWEAPSGTVAPPSDPAPQGKSPAAWTEPPQEWRTAAHYAVKKLGMPVVTLVDADGFPYPIRARHVSLTADGFGLRLPTGAPVLSGPACLTFHAHPEVFTGQEHRLFVGQVTTNDQGVRFVGERQVADWSLGNNALTRMWSFMGTQGKLKPRLAAEASRRGQPVPEVRLPK
ncbi:MAG: hemerythrin [Anaerolineae bacterium]|nr:hemerythrin [Anaerolineae bacterium]